MILIVCPEPADWLRPTVERWSAHGEVVVFAPWHLGEAPGQIGARLPSTWRRRMSPLRDLPAATARMISLPGWTALDGALGLWAGRSASRQIRRRLRTRALVDRVVSAALPAAVTTLVAPSGGAYRSFVVAARRGIGRHLISDTPTLRRLHADLDAAAAAHPECDFLRNYRAPRAAVVRQETERALATGATVRSWAAWREHAEAGLVDDQLTRWPQGPEEPPTAAQPVRARPTGWGAAGTRTALLAGLATARNGSAEALAALERTPELRLLVRGGPGAEPRALLDHPRTRPSTRLERRTLMGVDLVLAPAWCESSPPEVMAAARAGVPVIATERSLGFLTPTRGLITEVPVGQPQALHRATEAALARRHAGPLHRR